MKQPENIRASATGAIIERIETVEVDGVLYSERWTMDSAAIAFSQTAPKTLRDAWELPAEEQQALRDRALQQIIKGDELPGLLESRNLSGQDVLTILVGLDKLPIEKARRKGWRR